MGIVCTMPNSRTCRNRTEYVYNSGGKLNLIPFGLLLQALQGAEEADVGRTGVDPNMRDGLNAAEIPNLKQLEADRKIDEKKTEIEAVPNQVWRK